MAEYKVIDVSKWQGTIDWARVKAAGVDGAMLRAGYGAGNADAQFARNAAGCSRLGIPFGVYWFSYAYTPEMARREAAHCLEAAGPYKLGLPVAFDWEYDSLANARKNGVEPTRETVVAMAKAFLSAVEAAGYYAALYTNIDYLGKYFDAPALARFDRWLAAYRNTRPAQRHNMWQYTSAGSVDGICGKVDLNRAYVDYPAVIAKAGLDVPPPDYAGEVCAALGFEAQTREYIDAYAHAPAFWRRIWQALQK